MTTMPLRWKLEEVLERHDLSAYRIAKESGVSLTSIYKIKNNRTQALQGNVLDNILQAIHDLTGVEYGVGDLLEWQPAKKKAGK
jgi:DNA-binding Xre family transcriptional regulator